LVDTSTIECALWTQHDGYCDPTMMTNAVGKEAKALGAEFRLAVECVVRCVFSNWIVHSRMPLSFTPLLRLKVEQACDQWHFSQASTPLTGSHCINCVHTLQAVPLPWCSHSQP
jgi:hypothetical protein